MRDTVWKAPTVNSPVNADLKIPGSKSQTNRALVLAALSEGSSTITNPLIARDTLLMKTALESLGTTIEESSHSWHVTPQILQGDRTIDCGLAGTVMRFLPIVSALAMGDTLFDGDLQARQRPMGVTIESLRQLDIDVSNTDSRLPFTVHGKGSVTGRRVEIDASESSQFVSALLLAGARFRNGIEIHHRGEIIPSLPHIDMSISMLEKHNVQVECIFDSSEDIKWKIEPSKILAHNWEIEPDLSNALPFLAAAMVTGGSITIRDWPQQSTQPGWKAPQLLQKMGAVFRLDDAGLTLHGPESINGIDENLSDVGELTPVLVALAALADAPSHFYGISHLRGHETNRLEALTLEFTKCGGNVVETADGLKIIPSKLHGSEFETYNDHRMVMTASVLGLVIPEIHIVNPDTVSKTLPEFRKLWSSMLGIDHAL
ncbi:MAG: 3-phosphoshikimate 1-carboxyvinyltransferase [Candidatus Nanopelagicales bacterium]